MTVLCGKCRPLLNRRRCAHHQTHQQFPAVNLAASGDLPHKSSWRKEIEMEDSSSNTMRIRSPSMTDARWTTWAMRSHSMSR